MVIQGNTFVDKATNVLIPARHMNGGNWVFMLRLCNLNYPRNARCQRLAVTGDEVGVAYSKLFELALASGKPFALTLEDDMMVEPETLDRLFAVMDAHPEYAAVSALYQDKSLYAEPYVLGDPAKEDDFTCRRSTSGVVETNAIAMGCALWRMEMFKDERLMKPWFATLPHETQDIHFCRKARRLGYRFAVDCDHIITHLDTETMTSYTPARPTP